MAVSTIGGIESTAKLGQHPIHPMLVPFPIALLVATFACDIVFWASGNPFWANVAIWALGAGVATGAVAAVAGLADFLGNARIRALRDAWHHFIGNAAVLVLAFANLYIRWSAITVDANVLPWGIALSAVVTGLLLYTGWKGGEMVYRHLVGVSAVPASAPVPPPVEHPRRAA
jgi:uncharacterized membrane protein